jgi:hypothetical protein
MKGGEGGHNWDTRRARDALPYEPAYQCQASPGSEVDGVCACDCESRMGASFRSRDEPTFRCAEGPYELWMRFVRVCVEGEKRMVRKWLTGCFMKISCGNRRSRAKWAASLAEEGGRDLPCDWFKFCSLLHELAVI